MGFPDGVAPERNGSDAVDTSRGPGAPCPPGATPYEAVHAPDRAGVGRLVLPERLLGVREVAARLGVCRATVYAMVERGELRCVRIAASLRIHPADLIAALAPEATR
jgi:excisionase family DNA binding protein